MDRAELQKDMRVAVDLELTRINKRLLPSQRYTFDDVQELVEMVTEDMVAAGLTVRNFLDAVGEYRRRDSWMPTSARLLELHRELAARPRNPTNRALLPGSGPSHNMRPVFARAKELRQQGMEPLDAFGLAMDEVRQGRVENQRAAEAARQGTFQ